MTRFVPSCHVECDVYIRRLVPTTQFDPTCGKLGDNENFDLQAKDNLLPSLCSNFLCLPQEDKRQKLENQGKWT